MESKPSTKDGGKWGQMVRLKSVLAENLDSCIRKAQAAASEWDGLRNIAAESRDDSYACCDA
jgi:hypothetical protein